MRTKRILAKIIAITFALVVLFACAGIFSVEKVDVKYSISSADVQSAQSILNKYKGKNLLFLDKQDVINSLNSQPYLQVVSVEKDYPNVLSVRVQERRETYKIDYDGKTYILDENGVALNNMGEIKQGGEVIDLSFIAIGNNPNLTAKIKITDITLGKKIKTTNDEAVFKTFEIAKQFDLFDSIKSVTIEDFTGGIYGVSLETHTGVKVHIDDVLVDGQIKGQVGFEAYNDRADDYQKRFGLLITMYVEVDGVRKLVVDHVYNNNDSRLYEEIIQN